MFKTMACGRIGDHVVLVHSARTPSDAEWDTYLAGGARWLADSVGLLVVSDGGGPTSAQRRALRKMLAVHGGVEIRTAVVSKSMVVRSILGAIGLFVPAIRGFTPTALDAALTHIRATATQRPALLAEVERLRSTLS